MKFVSSKEAQKILHCTRGTLCIWKKTGKIHFKQITPKKILYDIDSISDLIEDNNQRKNVIYARVSTTKQKEDLNHQIEIIKSYCLSNGISIDEVYKDIGSGMNPNRLDLNKLIGDVLEYKIDTIYISFKDRLTRFNFDLYETLFLRFNTKIKILDTNEESNDSFQTELTNDLISIIHHFSMKLYSNRRKKLKEIEKIIESED